LNQKERRQRQLQDSHRDGVGFRILAIACEQPLTADSQLNVEFLSRSLNRRLDNTTLAPQ
jgi:hypothetical protein